MDLVQWLRDQLDEDEAIARKAAASKPGRAARYWLATQIDYGTETQGNRKLWAVVPKSARDVTLVVSPFDIPPMVATHIARHDPARVLREIDAKRKRIALHQPEPGQHPDFCGYDRHELPCLPLRLEAAPYEDRPGYLEKWRP